MNGLRVIPWRCGETVVTLVSVDRHLALNPYWRRQVSRKGVEADPVGARPQSHGILDQGLHLAKVSRLQLFPEGAAGLGIPPEPSVVSLGPGGTTPCAQDGRLPQKIADACRVGPLSAAGALIDVLHDVADVFLERRSRLRIRRRLKYLKTVLEAASKDCLRTQDDFRLIQAHARASVGLLQVGLERSLPVKHLVTPAMSAEPLRVGVVKIFDVPLKVVLPSARLLDTLL